MLENEFSQRYRAAQESTRPPADLVETTRTLVSYAQRNEADETSTNTGKPTKRRSRRPRWTMPLAACLAALLVLFGVGSAFLASGFPFMQEQAPAKAYAKTPNLLTAELGDGVVPFSLDGSTAFQGWGSEQARNALGCFSGLQFTLEGEGISRIQATISRGELYQITTETYDRTTEEGAAILREAASWKPSVRGTGGYLSDYDMVSVHIEPSDLDKTDPQQKEQLRLIKRIGATVDMPYEDEPLTFGFWFDDITYISNGLPDFDSLDGTELTITAVYTDGTCRTQAMTLHDGWFTTRPTDNAQGADSVMAEGPFPDKPKNSIDQPPYYNPVHTLYGEVTSVTDQPHPYSLENANIRADEAPVPYAIEDELPSHGSTATAEGTPSDERIHAADDTILASEWTWETDIDGKGDWVALPWNGFTAYATDQLTPFIPIYEGREVIAFGGNIDYLNRCRLKTNGWSLTKDGYLNDGNSFVMMHAEITNDRDESLKIGTEQVGALCTIDRTTNTTTFATAGVFAAKDNKGRLWSRDTQLWIEPGETVRLEVVFIADDQVAEADDVYCAFGNTEGIRRGETDAIDPNALQFISLGKLERR